MQNLNQLVSEVCFLPTDIHTRTAMQIILRDRLSCTSAQKGVSTFATANELPCCTSWMRKDPTQECFLWLMQILRSVPLIAPRWAFQITANNSRTVGGVIGRKPRPSVLLFILIVHAPSMCPLCVESTGERLYRISCNVQGQNAMWASFEHPAQICTLRIKSILALLAVCKSLSKHQFGGDYILLFLPCTIVPRTSSCS
jgi:hypothetical protein